MEKDAAHQASEALLKMIEDRLAPPDHSDRVAGIVALMLQIENEERERCKRVLQASRIGGGVYDDIANGVDIIVAGR